MTPQQPPFAAFSADSGNQHLSVTQLNRLAKQLLEDCFPAVTVVGELSTLSRPSSGHWYFTLKDDGAQIRCAFFRGRNRLCKITPEAGQQVQISGKVSLYEGRGDYQLIVDSLQPAGAGALAAAFEALKEELRAAGWFDNERKRPLPERIRHIAVVTSPTGAALQDILSVLQRRWPATRITVLPVLVQGQQAAAQIANAVRQANALKAAGEQDFDVLLVSRGGGSLEDLWPFNERVVAEAIYQSELVTISAVGHEVDFSITDFVADLRAPTPSAAAEMLSPDQDQLRSRLHLLSGRLAAAQQRQLNQRRERFNALRQRLRDPRQRLQEQAQRLDDLELRLQRHWRLGQGQRRQRLAAARRQLHLLSPEHQLQQRRREQVGLEQRLQRAGLSALRAKQQQMVYLTQRLRSLGPEQTLQRGYSIVTGAQGEVIRDATSLSTGQALQARFARGSAGLTVTSIEGDKEKSAGTDQ